jgi:hypothetical protein
MHEARHTAITEFLRDTGDLKLAQMLAGHADISTTANVYAHLDTHEEPPGVRRRRRRGRPSNRSCGPAARLKAGGIYVTSDGVRNIALAPISRLGSRRVAPIARQGSKRGANTTGAKPSFVF